MTNKHTIELEIPEGYEPDEGEQPRMADYGDWYLAGGKASQWQSKVSQSSIKVIILRKKAPKYHTSTSKKFAPLEYYGYLEVKVVEIKALEDALDMIGKSVLSNDETQVYRALKELVKS